MPYRDPERQRVAQRNWKRQKKDWFWAFKATLKCAKCEFSHPATLQFHHKGDKEREISRMVNMCASKEAIFEEMAKCIVLCANCHAIEHHNESQEQMAART